MTEHIVAIIGFKPGARKRWAARVIRDGIGLGITGAKSMIDVALQGGLVRLETQSDEHAHELAAKLRDLNFDAHVE